MPRSKLNKYEELATMPNVVEHLTRQDLVLKGVWNADFFQTDQPLVLELGCGSGEYTRGLAKLQPSRNYLGVDLKGDRLWLGAKQAQAQNLTNVGFLRTQIEHLSYCFGPSEVSEIWLTFPDPRIGKIKRCLTNPDYLELYKWILQLGGWVHLKTDSDELFEYAADVLLGLQVHQFQLTTDLYRSDLLPTVPLIQTHYERKYLEQGKAIKYLRFRF